MYCIYGLITLFLLDRLNDQNSVMLVPLSTITHIDYPPISHIKSIIFLLMSNYSQAILVQISSRAAPVPLFYLLHVRPLLFPSRRFLRFYGICMD
jgi:hypothetical protein